jgi:hypothetical protein
MYTNFSELLYVWDYLLDTGFHPTGYGWGRRVPKHGAMRALRAPRCARPRPRPRRAPLRPRQTPTPQTRLRAPATPQRRALRKEARGHRGTRHRARDIIAVHSTHPPHSSASTSTWG